jgi:hypothetical protein
LRGIQIAVRCRAGSRVFMPLRDLGLLTNVLSGRLRCAESVTRCQHTQRGIGGAAYMSKTEAIILDFPSVTDSVDKDG